MSTRKTTMNDVESLAASSLNDAAYVPFAVAAPQAVRAADVVLFGSDGNEDLSGSSGNDSISAAGGNDYLYGYGKSIFSSVDGGDDTLDGGGGSDVMRGGIGSDLYYVDSLFDRVEDLAAAAGAGAGDQDTVIFGSSNDVRNVTFSTYNLAGGNISNVEKIKYEGTSAFALYGASGNDSLYTGSGDDSLYGGAGNDYLDGGSNGSVGDIALYDGSSSQYIVKLIDSARGIYSVTSIPDSAYGADTIINIEKIRFGNGTFAVADLIGPTDNDDNLTAFYTDASETIDAKAGNDTIDAKGGDDSVFGNSGSDSLTGGSGNDTLDGGVGVDTLEGGDGNDVYVLDSGFDSIATDSSGTDEVRVAYNLNGAAYTLASGLESLRYMQNDGSSFIGVGNTAANTLSGNLGNDSLSGGAGNDSLAGLAGNDTFNGGTGNDTIDGGDGLRDTVVYSGVRSAYKISYDGVTGWYAISPVAGGETDLLNNVERVQFSDGLFVLNELGVTYQGTAGVDDFPSGGFGNDTFISGGGSDLIDGGLGNADLVILPGVKGDYTIQLQPDGSYQFTNGTTIVRVANVEQVQFGSSNTLYTIDTIPVDVPGTTPGNDSKTGTSGNDRFITGGGGNDTFDGAGGAYDVLDLDGARSDYVIYRLTDGTYKIYNTITNQYTITKDIEYVYFVADNSRYQLSTINSLYAGTNSTNLVTQDLVVGGTTNDTFEWQTNWGADTFDGVSGNDVIRLPGFATDYRISLNADGSYQVTHIATNVSIVVKNIKEYQTLSDNVKYQFASSGLYVAGTPNPDSLMGGVGNDVINSYEGNDTVFADAGNDTLYDSGGSDSLDGGTGTDLLVLTGIRSNYQITYNVSSNVYTVYDARTGTYSTVKNIENIKFSDTNSVLIDSVVYSAVATNGDDTLQGSSVGSNLNLLAGNDSFTALAGNNTINGNAGNDTIIGANSGDDSLSGGDGSDLLVGLGGNDTMVADTGSLQDGNDSLDGGAGILDVAVFAGARADYSVIFDAGQQTYQVTNRLTGATDFLRGIEYIQFDAANNLYGISDLRTNLAPTLNRDFIMATLNSQSINLLSGDDVYYALGGNNVISGDAGNDYMVAGSGNDSFDGGTGFDTMIGGSGDDTYVVDSSSDFVSEAANGGTDQIQTSLSVYTLGLSAPAVEGLIYTGTNNFNGIGNSLDNLIQGANGSDTLDGAAGNDTVVYNLSSNQYSVTVDADGGYNIKNISTNELDHIYNFENIRFLGNNVTSTLYSMVQPTVNNDVLDVGVLRPGNINNYVNGLDGNDTIFGRDGNDRLFGGLGSDSIMGGVGNDYIYAGLYSDTSSRDFLLGEGGNDTLVGSGGADVMYGGAGDDIFFVDNPFDVIIENNGGGNDTIVYLTTAFTGRQFVNSLNIETVQSVNSVDDFLKFVPFDFDTVILS